MKLVRTALRMLWRDSLVRQVCEYNRKSACFEDNPNNPDVTYTIKPLFNDNQGGEK